MLEYSLSVKLLSEHYLEFLTLKRGLKVCLSLHLSKCQIVGNHMPRLLSRLPLAGFLLNFKMVKCSFH